MKYDIRMPVVGVIKVTGVEAASEAEAAALALSQANLRMTFGTMDPNVRYEFLDVAETVEAGVTACEESCPQATPLGTHVTEAE